CGCEAHALPESGVDTRVGVRADSDGGPVALQEACGLACESVRGARAGEYAGIPESGRHSGLGVRSGARREGETLVERDGLAGLAVRAQVRGEPVTLQDTRGH